MRIIRYIAFGAAAVAALVLLTQPVQASCSDASLITTVDESVDPVERTHIWMEGYFNLLPYYAGAAPLSIDGPPISGNFNAVWWELGRGAANNGTNYWNSAFPQGWVYYNVNTYYGYPNTYYVGAQLFGGWGQGGVADCVANGACTCVLMSDSHGACSTAGDVCTIDADCPATETCNYAGYWAVTGNNNDAAVRTTQLRQPGLDPAGNASPIILTSVPVPFIVNTMRAGSTITVTARVDAPASGDYQLGTCDCLNGGGYNLYIQSTTGSPPTDRAIVGAGWNVVSGQTSTGIPFGQEFQFDVTCAGTEDVYLATRVIADESFGTTEVSANSTAIECDPALADPVDDNPLRPFEVDRERGTRPRQGRQGR